MADVIITLTVPQEELARIVIATCNRGLGVPPVPVPPTIDNTRAVVREWVRGVVEAYEMRVATEALPEIDTSELFT